MRYFIRLSYKGTAYSGWQRQENAVGVQQIIEDRLHQLLQQDIRLTGCGRTDAGVHAMDYIAHIDLSREWPDEILYKINRMLPDDIAVQDIIEVPKDAHARFDAESRNYVYRLHAIKDPFRTGLSTFWPTLRNMNPDHFYKMSELFRSYDEFFPFCKTGSNNKTMTCRIYDCCWEIDRDDDTWIFHIQADRFLRGMVRLMVGITLKVGEGQEQIETVRDALERQQRLVKSFSAPPQGLFFAGVRYPYLDN